MRPPASARESMRRLFVMKDCMRAFWAGVVVRGERGDEDSGKLEVEEGRDEARPPHSGRKTGREVIK